MTRDDEQTVESPLDDIRALYPDLRQLIEGLKDETWSEWDESVNRRLIAFGQRWMTEPDAAPGGGR